MRAQPPASHWIAGAAFDDPAGKALPVHYPATGEEIARLHLATPTVIDRAIDAAREGFAAWSATPPAGRARVLRRAADLIRARNRELSELETLDTGKPLSETLVADWASGADALEWFAALAATLSGEAIDLGGDFALTRREPLGVCFGIGAWNYPSQIACWKAAPALACGNALIFKPSELTPLGALKLGEILAEAGLPAGAFSVVQGDGATGAALTAHPEIAKVSLTGSVPTGRRVYATAAPASSRSPSSSAASPRSSSSTTPTSSRPSAAPCSATSTPPARSARTPPASSSSAASTTPSSPGSPSAPSASSSATPSTRP